MSIIHIHGESPKERFSIVEDSILNNRGLSPEARLLLAYALNRPKDWILNKTDVKNFLSRPVIRKGVQTIEPAGEKIYKRVMKELEEAGFLKREQVRQEGQFDNVIFHFYRIPIETHEAVSPKSAGGKSAGGKRTPIIKQSSKKTEKDSADADGLSEDPEEDIQEADAEQPEKASGNPFFDSHKPLEDGWDTVKPAYEKVIPLIAEAYSMEEEDSLVKVLSCVFTKEARYIKKGSEWADCTLTEAMTLEDIEAMLKDWKKTFGALMPSKPMTVQSNVSKWKNSKKGASGASGTESKLKPSAIPEDF